MFSLKDRLPTVEEKAVELMKELLRLNSSEPLIIEVRVRYPIPQYANARDRDGVRCVVYAERVWDGEEEQGGDDTDNCQCSSCRGEDILPSEEDEEELHRAAEGNPPKWAVPDLIR